MTGFTEKEVAEGIPHLLHEFRERPWILAANAIGDSLVPGVIVDVEYDGDDTQAVARTALDEVWDCVIATIKSEGDIHFDVLEATPA